MDKQQNTLPMDINEKERLFFPTNRRNLLSIISSGILGPKEVYAKYRSDILDVSKGYLPLFKEGVSADIVNLTTSNRDMNYPVLIELDEDKISSETMKEVYINDMDKSGKSILKLYDSVLNFDMINAVHFFSMEEQEDFLSKGFENVPMDNYNFEVSPELFEQNTMFDVTWFDDLVVLYNDEDRLERNATIADKVIASVALLSKNMDRSDDAILLRALIEFDAIPEGTVISPEYDVLVDLINSSIIADEGLSIDDDENIKLMGLLLNILVEMDPSDGWNPVEILDRLYAEYIELSGEAAEGIQKWYSFCRAIVRNEKDIAPKTFTDEHDTVKRAIFLFILRPEYEDIISSKSSYLNPGHVVRTLALFLAGFRVGYERLSNEFKTPKEYHKIFSLLKTYVISKKLGRNVSDIKTDFDLTCDIKDREYLCRLKISDNILTERPIDIPSNIHDIIKQMKENHYEETKYDVFDNRISYSFEYKSENRRQPVFIDIEKYIIKVSSPCVDFTKYKSYEKKYATNKVLAQMMKDNSTMQGKAYYVYEEGVHLRLERRVAISNIDNVDIIDIIEFVAKTADDFEKIYFKHDKVQ